MADGVPITAGSGTTIATDDCGAGGHTQIVKLAYSADGVATLVTADANGVLVDLGANNNVTVDSGAITATLAAETTKVIGTVNVAAGQTIAATGPVTDTQLRATPVPVSGTVTANAGTGTLAVSGPLTDTQIRATALPVSGSVTANLGTIADVATQTTLSSLNGKVTTCNTGAVVVSSGTITATGPLTDTEIRATALPVSLASVPSHAVTNAGTFATQATPTTATSGGPTTYHLVSAATTNLTNIKASAGQLYGWYIYNSNAAARKVAFHNVSGTPTAGASIYFTLVIPATSGANVFLPHGIPFSTGIAISTVTGLADTDTAAVAANDLIINLWYA